MSKVVVTFTSFSEDGVISVIINNTEYIYYLDGLLVDEIERLSKRAPMKAFHAVKRSARGYVKEGKYYERSESDK